MTPLAHSSGRVELFAPLWAILLVSATVVAAAALTRGGGVPGATDPEGRGSIWLSPPPAVRRVAPAVGAVLVSAPVLVVLLGTVERTVNPAATWVFLWTWVLYVPVTALLGPVWVALDPLRPATRALRGLLDRDPPADRIGPRSGGWIAAATLLVLAWIRVVSGVGSAPRTVALTVLGFVALQLAGGIVFGSSWHDRADPLVVLARAVGALSPLRRFGAPGAPPGVGPALTVAIGATLFDAGVAVFLDENVTIGKSDGWVLAFGTAWLLVAVAVPALAVWAASRLRRAASIGPAGRWSLALWAAAVVTAHALSLIALEWPLTFVSRLDGYGDNSAPFAYVEGTVRESAATSLALGQAVIVVAAAVLTLDALLEADAGRARRVRTGAFVVAVALAAQWVVVGA